MKEEFKGFYAIKENDFQYLWDHAVFVFDTNVLLNLYRYQESTTEQLLDVIEQLNDRVWIPYHVALEYQRNRLKVIADQNIKFSEVRKIVNKNIASLKNELDTLNLKKRHSTIDPESFIYDVTTAERKFIEELDNLEKEHYSVISGDKIRDKLDAILAGRIGPMPTNQKVIDKLEKEADERFKNKIPPGYMDDDKKNSVEPTFSYSNLIYQRKFSDYLVWSQLIAFATDSKPSCLIFVTDDNKEDWWLKIKQNGEKTISPRPELISEITQLTSVERFHMYSSESFLQYANKLLSAGVSNEAIEEVRYVARTRNREIDRDRMSFINNTSYSAEKAVYDWLRMVYGENHLTQL